MKTNNFFFDIYFKGILQSSDIILPFNFLQMLDCVFYFKSMFFFHKNENTMKWKTKSFSKKCLNSFIMKKKKNNKTSDISARAL